MKTRRSLLIAVLFAGSAIIGPSTPPASADNVAVVHSWVMAWNGGDPDAFTSLFTDDALFEHVPFGTADRGTAQIRAFYALVFNAMPDLKMHVLRSSVKGRHVTIEWIFTATDGLFQTGKPFTARGATVILLRDTQIARDSDYWDQGTIFRQIGLLPPGL